MLWHINPERSILLVLPELGCFSQDERNLKEISPGPHTGPLKAISSI